MKKKPNIVLINCDDLGYGDLACYGSQVNSTDNIDALARDGLRFTSFYMASALCTPSRGAMLTGSYPARIGFNSFDGKRVLFPGDRLGLNPEEMTIGRMLKSVGYRTMMVGKWHCGDQAEFLPTRHGFDHYYGLPYSNDMGRQRGESSLGGQVSEETEMPPLPLMYDEDVVQEQPDQASLIERYVEESIRFFRRGGQRGQPFFLYLAPMQVHLPLYAPARFVRESSNGDYGAAVAAIDWALGALRAEIRRLGIEQDTLIIFTSDNGSKGIFGGSNAPLRGTKRSTWEGGFRVPCIMCWPGVIPNTEISHDIVTSMDFLPTFARLAGAEAVLKYPIDGQDAWPVISEPNSGKTIHDRFFYYFTDDLEAVRSGRWKLHVRKFEEGESRDVKLLFDLEADLAETNNVYDSHPEIVAQLIAYIERCRIELGDRASGIEGTQCRQVGVVANPVFQSQYRPDGIYMDPMYDREERG